MAERRCRSRDEERELPPSAGGSEFQRASENPDLLATCLLVRTDESKLLKNEPESGSSQRNGVGDRRARRESVEKNLGRVALVAKRCRGVGLPLEDSIREGDVGLVRSARGLIPNLGMGPTTRSVARASVRRAVTNEGYIIVVTNTSGRGSVSCKGPTTYSVRTWSGSPATARSTPVRIREPLRVGWERGSHPEGGGRRRGIVEDWSAGAVRSWDGKGRRGE